MIAMPQMMGPRPITPAPTSVSGIGTTPVRIAWTLPIASGSMGHAGAMDRRASDRLVSASTPRQRDPLAIVPPHASDATQLELAPLDSRAEAAPAERLVRGERIGDGRQID